VSGMKRCILDGDTLADAAAAYRKLSDDLNLPAHFGHNADALWDSLGEKRSEPVEVVWRNSARSAERLGPQFDRIVAVLRRAAAEGRLKLELD
jgi:ribonuclease inhibitor